MGRVQKSKGLVSNMGHLAMHSKQNTGVWVSNRLFLQRWQWCADVSIVPTFSDGHLTYSNKKLPTVNGRPEWNYMRWPNRPAFPIWLLNNVFPSRTKLAGPFRDLLTEKETHAAKVLCAYWVLCTPNNHTYCKIAAVVMALPHTKRGWFCREKNENKKAL